MCASLPDLQHSNKEETMEINTTQKPQDRFHLVLVLCIVLLLCLLAFYPLVTLSILIGLGLALFLFSPWGQALLAVLFLFSWGG